MAKEYVFSASGSRIAYLKDNDVNWIHEEPSGKDRYELKQDRTATMKSTYDPTGAAVTNFGYTGGAACPPNLCNSGYNSQIIGAWTFIDGLEVLRNMRDSQRFQDRQFENLIEAYHPMTDSNGLRKPPTRRKKPPTFKPRSKEELARRRAAAAAVAATNNEDEDDDGINTLMRLFDLTALFLDKVKIIGFDKGQTRKVVNSFLWTLYSKACADSFKAAGKGAGIPTPEDVVRNRGLVIADHELLRSPLNNGILGLSDPERKHLLTNEVLGSQARSTAEIVGKPSYIFLKRSAFGGGSYPFEEVIIHEEIHASGVGSHPNLLLPFLGIYSPTSGHDLDGYADYEDILKNCRIPEGKK